MIGPPPPAYPSGPPPPPPKTRPMNLAHAVLWVTGITLVFWSLGSLAATVRESAQHDLFIGFVCQIAAYSLGLVLLLRLYGPEASIRQFLALRHTHVGFYPLALLLGLGALAAFLWSLKSGQFEDLDGAAHRVLMDDDIEEKD